MLEHYGDIFCGKMKAKELINALNNIQEDTEIYFFSHSLSPHIDTEFYRILNGSISWLKNEIIPFLQSHND